MSRRIALFAAVAMVGLLVGSTRPAEAAGLFGPTVDSISPTQVVPGVPSQVVKVFGSSFQSSAAVTLDPDTGIALTSTFVNANEIDLSVTVAGTAPLVARDVIVTQGLFGSSDTCALCMTVGPDITSVSGPLANTGGTGTFSITGHAFQQGSTVRISKSGYGFNATETETLTATGITVSGDGKTITGATVSTLGRAPGYWKVTVQKDSSSATFGNGTSTGLQITGGRPTISTITPSRIDPNETNKALALVGSGFARGMTVTVSGAGVTQSAATVIADANHATIRLTAASNAPVGVRNLTLRNADAQVSSSSSLGVGVAVPPPGLPTVTSVSPTTIGLGASQLPLTVTGANFVATPTVTVNPTTGVTIDSVTWNSSTQLTVFVSTAADTETGQRSLTVANGSDAVTKPNAFNVTSTFTVTGLTPPGRPQGYTGTFVVNGAGFTGSPTVSISPATGLTVGTPTRDSASKITVPISVASDAPLSARDVIVNATTCSGCFTVGKVPTVTSMSPTSGNGGGQVAISDITGADFAANPTVTLERTGQDSISMVDVQRTATHLSGTFDLTNAAPGKWNLRVTNVDGGTAAKTDAFTVVLPAPTLTGATPDSIAQNTTVPIAVHIVGTQFAPGMVVSIPAAAGVAVADVVRTSPTTADVKISASDNAALGSRDLKITNADGQIGVCDSCLVVTQGNQQPFFGGFNAYDNFAGGGFVAAGRLGGTSNPVDIVTAPNAGGGPHVRAFAVNPNNGTTAPLSGFMAYNPDFTGGVHVAVGDINGDGTDEIITGAGPGGGPHVRAFHLNNDTSVSEPFGTGFMAYDPSFAGGVWVGAGDVTGDGKDEIITGAGAGGGPHVKVFTLAADGHTFQEIGGFMAYGVGYTGGVAVAAGNLILEDSEAPALAEIATTPSLGGGPHVRVFDKNGAVLREFAAFGTGDNNGYRVAIGDFDFDTVDDLAISRGSSPGIYVAHVTGTTPFVEAIAAPNPAPLTGGATVAAADFDGDGDADLAVAPDHDAPVAVQLIRPLSH